MTTLQANYDGVAAAVPVTIGYEKTSVRGAAYFIGAALGELLRKSGLKKDQVDGLALSSFTLHPDTAVAMTNYFGLNLRWLEHLPMGGASGVAALKRAARAVQAGDAEVVACIAGDTNQRGGFKSLVEDFSTFAKDAVYPYGATGPNMVFAMITQNYMAEYGAARQDFGRLCIAQRTNAMPNRHALLRQPLTLDAYMAARPVAEPLHLFDCVLPCAGADAFLVMAKDRAKTLGLPYAVIASAVERYNAYASDPIPTRGGWAMERERLYGGAGLEPTDMDFVQTYDDYPVISFLQLEDLGFAAKGEAAKLVRDKKLTVDSALPHNTSGGQLSMGQAGASGGFVGMVEALRQLTGQTTGAAIPRARMGVVSGYGMVIYDRCLCTSAAILKTGARA